MKNQVDAMRTFGMREGVAHFLNSSLNKSAVSKVREDVLASKDQATLFRPRSLTKEGERSLSTQCKNIVLRHGQGPLHQRMGPRLPTGIQAHKAHNSRHMPGPHNSAYRHSHAQRCSWIYRKTSA